MAGLSYSLCRYVLRASQVPLPDNPSLWGVYWIDIFRVLAYM
jgi:hypothetical protein